MPAKYDEIRPIGFRLNPDIKELPFSYEAMQFPEEWKRHLIKMQAASKQRNMEQTSLPINDLNKTMRALVPDLISIDKNAGRMGERSWLRSGSKAASPDILRLLMYWWGYFTFAKVPEAARSSVLKQLTSDQLVWNTAALDLADWDIYPNGTAKPKDESLFSLLPDLITSKLSHPNATFELSGRSLDFYRVPLSPGSLGAELISWPPIEAEIRKQRYYYSILLTVTLQTIPFQSFPVIHIDCGVRRWVSLATGIRGGETSVYLRTNIPWLEGIHQSNSFQVAPIRWVRRESDFLLVWGSRLTDIFNRVNPQQKFPEPTLLAIDPVTGFNIDGTPNAAIVYRNAFKPNHLVQPGLMPGDRKPLVEQISTVLEPDFMLTDGFQVVLRPSAPKNPFTDKGIKNKEGNFKITEEILAMRHGMISAATNGMLSLEIYYQKPETLQTFRTKISELLGLQLPDKFPVTLQPSDISITIDAHSLGAIGDALKLDMKIANTVDRAYASISERIEAIDARLIHTRHPTIAFIELANADKFEDEDDPKRAIRCGFTHTGRHTQFIDRDGDTKNLDNRVTASLLDGFRQLGVHRYVNHEKGLPQGWNFVGIWLIHQSKERSPANTQQFIPVIVFIDGSNGNVDAIAPGLENWMPYSDALLAIGQGKVRGYERRNQALPFIQQRLENDVAPQGNTLVLCDAQNLRQTWSWLANSRISIDSLSFGEGKPRPISDWPGLRVVRVRSSDQHETAEWYAEKGDDFGFSRGLFRMGERVFASTYGKPVQFSNVSKNMSILDNPSSSAWNPGLFELTVAGIQPGDDPATIAGFAHLLRNVSIQYDDATAHPLPLHLAKLMEEYLLLVTFELDTDLADED